MITKKNNKLIFTIIIFICLGLIFTMIYIIINEIHSAKEGCKNINGIYQLKDFKHLCNNKSFYKYSDGTWDFEKGLDWSIDIPK